MRFTAVVLACASTVLGYTILSPNQSQGWTNQGPQRATWQRVATDRENITIVLTNTNRSLMPTDQVLSALVDGNLGNMTLNPPSAGWPSPGPGYVLNFASEATNLNQILAQSPPFEIELSTVVPTNTKTTAGNPTSASTSDKDAPTDNTIPKNGGLSNFGVPVALAVLAGLVPAILA
ncbi:hypothetical protein D9611_002567 [Ephemerocybe angulata]|uniref:Yeast cell wall synthesis Kre9/Knh1-like N-terminal domain-containing protein n=1 Tax=Ephemerocybe angulata TaxID=980116 RepID=A0A8H5C1Y4_9AGAR|nr:hypothetical protein D9611_002567 [Tulosesus angulatus]